MTTAEALNDLHERLTDAEQPLRMLAVGHDAGTPDRARLNGKREGVALALSYVEETLRVVA